jgi:hypothetical protein
LLDDPRSVGAGSVRQLREARVCAGADVSFHRIDTGGVEADQDLSGGGREIGDLLRFENGGIAEAGDADRFHWARRKFMFKFMFK